MGENKDENIDLIISALPKSNKGWMNETSYKYEGFWLEEVFIQGVLTAQRTFNPQPDSLVLATFPKCGTTWFASLLFTTINRTRYSLSSHPLLTSTPQSCLTWIEFYVLGINSVSQVPSIHPLIKTHIPYTMLPGSIKCSNCPIVYVCRDPKDVFISYWMFANLRRPKELPRLGMEEAFDLFSRGACNYGSYWDHVLCYWKASLEMPEKVLFLRYEDMKNQPITTLKRLATFVGFPFSVEEERDGVIEEIVRFCSFEHLASLQVNQDTASKKWFRKGKTGDHKNYLTDEMIRCLDDITEARFKGSGLDLQA